MTLTGSSITTQSELRIPDLAVGNGDPIQTPQDDKSHLNAFNSSPQGKKIIDWIKKQYSSTKTAHTQIRNQWYVNLAMYKGDHYTVISNNAPYKTRPAPGRTRLTINRVRPMIRTQLAQMTSQKPTAEVVPASDSLDAVMAAEAGQSVYKNVFAEKKIWSKYGQAAFWQANLGVGYLKIIWDKSARTANGDFGDHQITAPSPFHILVPELLVEDIEEQPFVLNVFTKPVAWVKAHYGDILPKDYKPTVIGTNEIFESSYLNVSSAAETGKEADSSLIIEAWIKPGTLPELPKGGLVTILDNIAITAVETGLPYNHGQYPFAKFDGIPSGSYYHTSATEDFMQLQQELNRNRSQRAEARNMTSRPQWISPRGILDVSKWMNRPGQVIEYIPGLGKPEPMPINSLPAYVINEEDSILRDMEDVSGQHQVSRGQNPSGITSGTAINYLQEADNSFMSTVFSSIEEGIEKVAKQILELAVQYWDIPRLVKTTGSEGFSVKELRGADIKEGTDIRIESGSALPDSKAARTAFIMDCIKTGLIPADKGLELLQLPSLKSFIDEVNRDKKKAQRENVKMEQLTVEEITKAIAFADQQKQMLLEQMGISGDPSMSPQGAQIEQIFNQGIIPVEEWDDHEKHLETHEAYMKTEKFESLPEEVQDQFKKHRQSHIDQMQMKMMTDLMQNPSQGIPDQLSGMMGSGQGPGSGSVGNNPAGNNQFSGLPQDSGGDNAGGVDGTQQ